MAASRRCSVRFQILVGAAVLAILGVAACGNAAPVKRGHLAHRTPATSTATTTAHETEKAQYSPTAPVTPDPPKNARSIMSDGGIVQWQDKGTNLTTLWLDLEDDADLTVGAGSFTDNPRQGFLEIRVTDENGSDAAVGGVGSGLFPTTTALGALTLTDIDGSLADGNMLIDFSYEGGTGSFDPQTDIYQTNGS